MKLSYGFELISILVQKKSEIFWFEIETSRISFIFNQNSLYKKQKEGILESKIDWTLVHDSYDRPKRFSGGRSVANKSF